MLLPKVHASPQLLDTGAMNFFSYLTNDDINYVHQSSLEILEQMGLLVRN